VELAAVNQILKGEEVRDIIFEDEPRYTFFRFLHDYKGSEVTSIRIPPPQTGFDLRL
jgi:hypothetical protein